MTSLILEWPGRWRTVGLGFLLALPLLPALPLLWPALVLGRSITGPGFGPALVNSGLVAILVAIGAFVLGLPVGVLNALYEYRGRQLLLPLALLPLLAPPFLWPLGWRWLLQHQGHNLLPFLSGYSGCVLMFLPGALTLVLFSVIASLAGLSGSQVDAARLAGGERTLFRLSCRHAAAPAALAAVLAGVLTLSNPAAGFAVGLPTAASEILISFAAFYDYGLAARQSLLLALVVLGAALPIAWFAAPRLAAESSARQTRAARRSPHPGMGMAAGATLGILVMVLTLFPSLGLVLPLRRWNDLARATSHLTHTGMNTLIYAIGSGVLAAGLALGLAICAGREERLRRLALGVCLTFFALPPVLLALGFVQGAAHAPAWADPVLRGRLAVCLALGVRFFPLGALLALRSWGAMPPSLSRAAGIHGVPVGRYLWSVALPLNRAALLTSVLLVGLLSTAEIGMVLLLYPPGEESLPVHIFQRIGYPAPSSRMAALCAVDLALAIGVLIPAWRLGGGDRA
jgi:iron(III) transport system permease protein